MQRLNRLDMVHYLKEVKEELGNSNQKRVEIVIDMLKTQPSTQNSFSLKAILEHLYPDKSPKDALSTFRTLRHAIKQASEERGSKFTIEVDTKLKDDISHREFYSMGISREMDSIREYTDQTTTDVNRTNSIDANAIETSGKAMAGEKRDIVFFLSYAHDDKSIVDDFMPRLKSNLNISRKYNYTLWHDESILVGEEWEEQIQEAMREADFGLCLVSLAFLNSTYISDKELPYFLDETNPNGIIPIGLSRIDFGLHDLKGLEEKQLFRYNDKFFSKCRGTGKDDFVLELYKQIESRVDKLLPKSDKKKMTIYSKQP